jgi:hypothetical protein
MVDGVLDVADHRLLAHRLEEVPKSVPAPADIPPPAAMCVSHRYASPPRPPPLSTERPRTRRRAWHIPRFWRDRTPTPWDRGQRPGPRDVGQRPSRCRGADARARSRRDLSCLPGSRAWLQSPGGSWRYGHRREWRWTAACRCSRRPRCHSRCTSSRGFGRGCRRWPRGPCRRMSHPRQEELLPRQVFEIFIAR